MRSLSQAINADYPLYKEYRSIVLAAAVTGESA